MHVACCMDVNQPTNQHTNIRQCRFVCVFYHQTNGAVGGETPQKLPPLLSKLTQRRAEKLDYMGVSYGLTSDLLKCVFCCFLAVLVWVFELCVDVAVSIYRWPDDCVCVCVCLCVCV